MMANLLQVTLTLLLVLASIAGLAWFLQAARKRQGGAGQTIHIEATVAVGTRERVVLIEVAGQWLLLGVAPGRVTTLAQLATPPLRQSEGSVGAISPGSWLATYLGKVNGR